MIPPSFVFNDFNSSHKMSVEHSPCMRGVPGLSPGLTALFSHPVTCVFYLMFTKGG